MTKRIPNHTGSKPSFFTIGKQMGARMKIMAKGSTNIPRRKEIPIMVMRISQRFIPSPRIKSLMKTAPPALAYTALKHMAP